MGLGLRAGWARGVWGWFRVGGYSRCQIWPAGAAQPPEDNLGLVHGKAVIVLRVHAGRLAHHAVGILDPAAATTHQVMMIVAGAPFEAGRVAGRPHLSNHVDVHAGRQNVVDGLLGHRTDPLADALVDLLDGGVRMAVQPLERGQPRRGGA